MLGHIPSAVAVALGAIALLGLVGILLIDRISRQHLHQAIVWQNAAETLARHAPRAVVVEVLHEVSRRLPPSLPQKEGLRRRAEGLASVPEPRRKPEDLDESVGSDGGKQQRLSAVA